MRTNEVSLFFLFMVVVFSLSLPLLSSSYADESKQTIQVIQSSEQTLFANEHSSKDENNISEEFNEEKEVFEKKRKNTLRSLLQSEDNNQSSKEKSLKLTAGKKKEEFQLSASETDPEFLGGPYTLRMGVELTSDGKESGGILRFGPANKTLSLSDGNGFFEVEDFNNGAYVQFKGTFNFNSPKFWIDYKKSELFLSEFNFDWSADKCALRFGDEKGWFFEAEGNCSQEFEHGASVNDLWFEAQGLRGNAQYRLVQADVQGNEE
ncbi:hypothetical protein H6501_04065 [Candidatus Woesearchaeota archaeon]|nr:hypothetical protein [Nanoarchaeota archaeon]MCB9370748.1 hypothetical protein [Candidatus Woesearchaeota archaeon]USN43823.1 MAG: hypothetical protein H6500_05535 [Candidatus Woesearchaeota archaeon]